MMGVSFGPRSPVAGPLIIGHRGFAALHPDNSLAGVRAALAAGADGVEVDVRPCADGCWVCHHDRSRDRRPVRTCSRAALRRAGVPTLEDVLAIVPAGRWLYVEVKPLARTELARLGGALVGLLRQAAARIRLLSSSLAVLEALGRGIDVPRSWVIGEMPEQIPGALELSPHHLLVERLAGWGRLLHPWTVNRPERMRKVAALGVASITSNRPDLALRVLRG
jgi:glycerophosphoryl diester phosphodiesterase